jgi:hypothetical protein
MFVQSKSVEIGRMRKWKTTVEETLLCFVGVSENMGPQNPLANDY